MGGDHGGAQSAAYATVLIEAHASVCCLPDVGQGTQHAREVLHFVLDTLDYELAQEVCSLPV